MNKIVLKSIDFYQKNISPNKNSKCRHIPSCSTYAKDAFNNYNFFYASFLTTKRLLRCNPLVKPSFDPIPKFKKELERKALEDKIYYEKLKKHKKIIMRKRKKVDL